MDLLKFFENDQPDRVTVIGDVMIDRYIHGKISRISPEAPVPVFHRSHSTQTVGGAGNVAANIVSLGGRTGLLSYTGDDAARLDLLDLCTGYGLDTSLLIPSAERCTISKSRFVCAGQQVLRYDEEEALPLSVAETDRIREELDREIENSSVVVISDYGKGLFLHSLAQDVIKRCRALKVPVIVDPKGTDYSKYHGATTVTPNLKELGEAVGRQLSTDDEVVAAGRELIAKFEFDFVLATRSEKGMSVIAKDEVIHIPTSAREVFDVSGAGDTVVASIALALAKGLTRVEAAYIANAAAGVAVSKRGTARISAVEVRAELQRSGISDTVTPTVLSIADAKKAADHWRAEGYKVGFTNGCFDIIHFGHTSILERARAKCDRLIVGLNSDASVRRLKGDSRPVNGLHDRAAVLAALRSVDAVVAFEEDTPLELIRALMPDILIKGADYTVETVVGADIVQANGGEVHLLSLEDGRSTTAVIAKVTA